MINLKIFIDPGHGGTNVGAVANGLKESDINLSVSLKLGSILKDNRYEVKYSRESNTNLTLFERAEMANNWNANYFVSIHCNSAASRQANGSETFVYKLGTSTAAYGESIQTQLVLQNGLKNRGLKEADFTVLVATKMPAALVELAFISNPYEAKLLSLPEFQMRCARGIADGIINYVSNK